MIQKIIAGSIVAITMVPMLVAAESGVPLGPTVEQLLAREAFLKAITEKTSVACVVSVSKNTIKVGDLTTVYWGSYGDKGGGLSPAGASTLKFDKPAIYTYRFAFESTDGVKTECPFTISVSSS